MTYFITLHTYLSRGKEEKYKIHQPWLKIYKPRIRTRTCEVWSSYTTAGKLWGLSQHTHIHVTQ